MTVVAALSILASRRVSQTLAADHSWFVSSGTWSTAADWNSSGVPGINDNAWVVNGGTVDHRLRRVGKLRHAHGGRCAESGTVQLVSGGSLTGGNPNVYSDAEMVGYTGSGTFSQTGGTNNATRLRRPHLGLSTAAAAARTISAVGRSSGKVLSSAITAAGRSLKPAARTLTAGPNSTVSLSFGNNAGSSGLYNLSGGSLATYYMIVGMNGSGGVHSNRRHELYHGRSFGWQCRRQRLLQHGRRLLLLRARWSSGIPAPERSFKRAA